MVNILNLAIKKLKHEIQIIEQRTVNPFVAGSSPAWGGMFNKFQNLS